MAEKSQSRLLGFFTDLAEDVKLKRSKARKGKELKTTYERSMLESVESLSDAKDALTKYMDEVFAGEQKMSISHRAELRLAIQDEEKAIETLKAMAMEDIGVELKDPEDEGEFEA